MWRALIAATGASDHTSIHEPRAGLWLTTPPGCHGSCGVSEPFHFLPAQRVTADSDDAEARDAWMVLVPVPVPVPVLVLVLVLVRACVRVCWARARARMDGQRPAATKSVSVSAARLPFAPVLQ